MKENKKLDKQLEEEFSEDMLELKSKLQDIVGQQSESNAPSSKFKILKFGLPILAIAASILLAIIFLPQLWNNSGPSNLYASYYETYPMALNQRGDGDVKLNEAIALYINEDFDEAALAFKELYKEKLDPVLNLYSASAYQASGKYEKAIELYDQVISSNDDKVTEQALWYKAMAYLSMGEVEKSKEILSTFEGDHYKFKEAQELLEKL